MSGSKTTWCVPSDPGVPQVVRDAPVGQLVQPVGGQRRTGHVAAQPLEALAVGAGDRLASVQREAVEDGAVVAGHLDEKGAGADADPGDALAAPAAEGQPALDGGGLGGGQHGRAGGELGVLGLAPLEPAVSAMRRPPQEGQMPRPLQENATSRSSPQRVQRTRAKPLARMPQSSRAVSSRRTKRGRPGPVP